MAAWLENKPFILTEENRDVNLGEIYGARCAAEDEEDRLSMLHKALDPEEEYRIGYDIGYNDGENDGYYTGLREAEYCFDFPPAPAVSYPEAYDFHNPWAELNWLLESKPRNLFWDTEPDIPAPFYLI